MTRNSSSTNSDSNLKVIAVVISVVFAVVAAAWWMSHTPVELDEHGYDVTIALYRVCNQRSSEGLQQIEEQVRELEASQGTLGESHQVILDLIATAKAGDWQDAAIACRQALEDQVQH
ncbi:putative secreted protein [Rhodopirellula maiorica SM1]|uniref:Putative secreted protein n=1 Tax=Rhodopirellula maiorica SM1 TaxID=1265738 RepID=M5RMP4_9BACT|nr:hypothetical protein [Rhodopirellula maiorica]EMI20466.1 putative secreted protein [Rhodopirellula maiorica SM1]